MPQLGSVAEEGSRLGSVVAGRAMPTAIRHPGGDSLAQNMQRPSAAA